MTFPVIIIIIIQSQVKGFMYCVMTNVIPAMYENIITNLYYLIHKGYTVVKVAYGELPK